MKPLTSLALLITAASLNAQDIRDYLPAEKLGTAMMTPKEKAAFNGQRVETAMRGVEGLRLYAVATRSVAYASTATGDSREWNLELGETFPFLGFYDDRARVRLGYSWIDVPRDSIRVFKLSDEPQAASRYKELLAKTDQEDAEDRRARAIAGANARQDARDRVNSDWRAMQQQRALNDIASQLQRLQR